MWFLLYTRNSYTRHRISESSPVHFSLWSEPIFRSFSPLLTSPSHTHTLYLSLSLSLFLSRGSFFPLVPFCTKYFRIASKIRKTTLPILRQRNSFPSRRSPRISLPLSPAPRLSPILINYRTRYIIHNRRVSLFFFSFLFFPFLSFDVSRQS